MALPFTDADWVSEEINAAENFADVRRKPLREIINRFVGNWHDRQGRALPTPENIVFAWVKWMKAQIAFSAPKMLVKAEWHAVYDAVARYMQEALGKWAKVFPLGIEQDLVCRDALFGYGVFKLGMEAAGDSSGVPAMRERHGQGSLRPFAVHVPVWDFGMDSRCAHWTKARFLYAGYWKDLDDVQATRGADPAALEKLVSSYDASGTTGDGAATQGETADRKQVRMVDIYFPEVGMIGTLASTGAKSRDVSRMWVRPPRKWYGPAQGPFVVVGFEQAPDDPYPISPIQSVMEELESMWQHQAAATTEVNGAKRFIGIDAANDTAEDQLKKVPPNGIAKIKGLAQREVQQLEVGGAHSERYDHIDRMRQQVQLMLGFSEAQQGVANAKTATSNSIAQQNSDVISEDMRKTMMASMLMVMDGVGWYMFYDPNYQTNLAIERYTADPMTGQFGLQRQFSTFYGGIESRFIDGQFFPGQDLSWEEDFQKDIAPNSMQHQTDQAKQQDALTIFELAPQAYQMMASYPGLNVRMLVDDIGESMNRRDLFEQLINEMVAQRAMQPPPPGQMPPAATGQLGPPMPTAIGAGQPFAPPGLNAGLSGQSPGMVHAAGGFGRPGASGGVRRMANALTS